MEIKNKHAFDKAMETLKNENPFPESFTAAHIWNAAIESTEPKPFKWVPEVGDYVVNIDGNVLRGHVSNG